MTSDVRIFTGGAMAVLGVASVGAAISRILGFRYWTLFVLSMVIYLAVGSSAIRGGASVGRATAIGFAVGLVDVTLGWAISWQIGPGRLEDSPFTGATAIVVGGLVALIFNTFIAFVGAKVASSPRHTHAQD